MMAKIILYGDPDDGDRLKYAGGLMSAGFTVIARAAGDEILDELSRSSPMMILLERRLYGMTGFEASRRAREVVGPDVPIVFLTRSEEIDDLERILSNGGDDMLIKEKPAILVRRIRMWNRSPHLRQSMEERRETATRRVTKVKQLIASGAAEGLTMGELVDRVLGIEQGEDAPAPKPSRALPPPKPAALPPPREKPIDLDDFFNEPEPEPVPVAAPPPAKKAKPKPVAKPAAKPKPRAKPGMPGGPGEVVWGGSSQPSQAQRPQNKPAQNGSADSSEKKNIITDEDFWNSLDDQL
ncbi:MAG: response regulator [Pseudomonadota bacterium]